MNKKNTSKKGIPIKSHATEQALTYLQLNLDKGTWEEGSRLPRYRALAAHAGVAPNSMLKALRILKAEKKIAFKAKVGIFAGPEIPGHKKESEYTQSILKWERAKDLLKKDMLSGTFHNDVHLPALKEIASAYGITIQTLRKAINALIKDQLLIADKRLFRILRYEAPIATHSIVLIADEPLLTGEVWFSERIFFDQFVQGLEKECALRKIKLVKRSFATKFTANENITSVLGFIIWHTDTLNESATELAFSLQRYHKQVAVLLFIGASDHASAVKTQKLYSDKYKFFVSNITTDKITGQAMGRFLLGKGHKKICCFGFSTDVQWHQAILSGFTEAFSLANIPDAVITIQMGNFPDDIRNRYTTPEEKSQSQMVDKEIDAIEQGRALINNNVSNPFARKIDFQLMEARFARHSCSYYTPLFKKTLDEYSDASAWVFHSEIDAIYGALEFFKAKKVKVPEQMGVVSLNNMPDSSINNLTSYYTDYSAAARKMLTMVLYPEHARKSLCIKGSTVFDIDGMVIDRGSV